VTVVPITVISPIIATFIATIIIRTGPLQESHETNITSSTKTHRIIESNPDWSTTEIFTVEVPYCAVSILSGQILKNSVYVRISNLEYIVIQHHLPLAWNVAINISEGNAAGIPSKVFQILQVVRKGQVIPIYDESIARTVAGPGSPWHRPESSP
jgi:hypothetical protein